MHGNRLLQQIIPVGGEADPPGESKSKQGANERPNFSLPQMSANFRRFNAR
jgi:hypothetical protein